MADVKITDLPEATEVADDDQVLLIDVSDNTAGTNGTDKRSVLARLADLLFKYDVETAAELEASNPIITGRRAICRERAHANYILAAEGYTALPGDIVAANGRVWALVVNDHVHVDWFGYNVLDSTQALLGAVKRGAGKEIRLAAKTYICTEELLLDDAATTLSGAGKGYYRWHFEDPTRDVPASRILFTGTGTKSVKTRYGYRGSVSDPNDAPLSTGINIQNDGITIRDLTIELYCDYSDTSFTNFGDDWDVGVFHGSRLDLTMEDVNVVGYWREASIWLDSTRGVNLPELNGYPETEGAGADGISLVRVLTCGGYWGIRKQGPLPKDGLLHFGFQYDTAAKFVFSALPVNGDTVTIDDEVYTFKNSPVTRKDVQIAGDVESTIINLKTAWINQDERLVPYDTFTLVESVSELEVYSTSTTNSPMSTTSANIAVQTIAGAAATQTEAISDPAPYYDDTLGAVDDGRCSLGASDFVIDNCVIYTIEHHSGVSITTKSVPEDADNDTAAGCLWVDGLGGSALIHRHFATNTRFHSSREPYNIKLGFSGRFRDTECTHDGASSSISYGKVVGHREHTALAQFIGYDEPGSNFPLNVNGNQAYTDFYLQGNELFIRGDAELRKGLNVGHGNSGTDWGIVDIRSGINGNTEIRMGNESVGTVGRIRMSQNGFMTLSVRSDGTGALEDVLRGSDRGVWANLPTSSSGLTSGELWNDSGTVRIIQ